MPIFRKPIANSFLSAHIPGMNDNDNTPAENRARRKALGLTQEALALAAGVTIPTVARFETGKPMHKSSVEALEAALRAAEEARK